MKTNKDNPLQPVKPDNSLEIEGCLLRARGVLHLLAVAYVKSDGDESHMPTDDEKEGIMWLSMQVGDDLRSALDEELGKWKSKDEPTAENAA